MAQQATDAGQALETVPAASLTLHGSINEAVNLAQLMAKAKVALPAHLHNNPGECLAIVMMAQTWGMNPYMVGQKTSVINSRLMYEGQLVNAVVNRSGFLAGRLTYETKGEGEDLIATVTGLLKGESTPRTITIGMPKQGEARNSPLWKTQPEQQLLYKAVRMWARRHIPEVLLGVYTPEDDFHELPRELVEVKEANAKAVENRLTMISSSPMMQLDPEILEEMERIKNSGDVFTRNTAPAPVITAPAVIVERAAVEQESRKETAPVEETRPKAEEKPTPIAVSAAQAMPNSEMERTAAGAADLFSKHEAEHSRRLKEEPNEAAMARQDYIDAGHPVIHHVLLCPETNYMALSQDTLKKIAAGLMHPGDAGLEPTPEAFQMIGGASYTKAMSDKGLGIIAGKVRQAFGV